MGTRQRREGRGIIAPKRIIGPPCKTSLGKNSSMAIIFSILWGELPGHRERHNQPSPTTLLPSQAKPGQVLSAARPLAFSAPATLTAAS